MLKVRLRKQILSSRKYLENMKELVGVVLEYCTGGVEKVEVDGSKQDNSSHRKEGTKSYQGSICICLSLDSFYIIYFLPEHCACSFIADIVFAGACQVFVSRDFFITTPLALFEKEKKRKEEKKIRRDVKDKITSCMVRSYACTVCVRFCGHLFGQQESCGGCRTDSREKEGGVVDTGGPMPGVVSSGEI